MKKLLLSFLIVILSFSCALAESPELAEDYVLSQGFTIADISEYSGKPKCFMQEDSDWQTVGFTTADTSYCVIALKEFDANYNPETLRMLFFDLVQKFDWEVVFYWPDYDTADKIAISYGIESDLDKTKLNLSDKDRFVEMLEKHLFQYQPVNDQISATNAAIETYKDTIYQNFGFERNSVTEFLESQFGLPLTVSEFSPVSVNVCAEYVLANDFAACRTGVENKNMLLYAYPENNGSTTASDSEIQQYFESLKLYLADNTVSIVSDGVLAGADTMSVAIDILTTTDHQRAVYDLITGDCTIIDMD